VTTLFETMSQNSEAGWLTKENNLMNRTWQPTGGPMLNLKRRGIEASSVSQFGTPPWTTH
jgi:hypothetical protein